MLSRRLRGTLAAGLVAAGVAASAAAAHAATTPTTTFPVTSAADNGAATLREEIKAVNNDKSKNADVIQFKISGGGVHKITLASPLPAITRSNVTIDGYSAQSGAAEATDSAAAKLKVVLDAVNVDEGLEISADNVTVKGLDIQHAQRDGVLAYGTGDVIAGNYVGTDVTGSVAEPGWVGVTVDNSGNTVGGPDPADGNVISSNTHDEVLLEGVGGHHVQGNRIGTDAAGQSAIADSLGDGVYLEGDGNEIRDNLISGEYIGISLGSDHNTVQHNNVGTDVKGTAALPDDFGIWASGDGNLIGGTGASDGNLLSGNAFDGVRLGAGSGTNNDLQGNLIGTTANGDKALPNQVGVDDQSGSNTIGGTDEGAGNVIAGNTYDGVRLTDAKSVVTGNQIGTDLTGTLHLGNGRNGVNIESGDNNQVGGTSDGDANTIAYNADDGVAVTSFDGGVSGIGNAIVENSIHNNDDNAHTKKNMDDLGIDLGADGGTPNDPLGALDVDAGANELQNDPVLTDAEPSSIAWQLDSEKSQKYRLDFYANTSCDPSGSGEGETYLGSQTRTTSTNGYKKDSFTPATPLTAGQRVTVTATKVVGGQLRSTSEFSPCEKVVVPSP